MKDALNLWLSQRARIPGVLACGVRYSDRTTFTQQWADGFTAASLERSLACMSDLWRLFRLNSINGQWLRWGFSECWFYAAQRADGTLLGVITTRSEIPTEVESIGGLLATFLQEFPAK